MSFIPSLGEVTSKTYNTFKRFPITICWAIIGTLFTIISVEYDVFDTAYNGKVILTFVLGISWLIATRFFEEQFRSDKTWFFILTLLFLFLFFNSVVIQKHRINTNAIIRFSLYFIAGHLFVMVAPFLLKWNKSAYFNYVKSVFIAIVRSLFFSLILYLGIVLALLAVKHLFNVGIKDYRFFQIFIICIGIVNTWIYLADFPKDVHNQLAINYTKALEVLVKHILIPLVVLYLIILYAYSLKIIITWSLPKGWVSYLIIALAFIGFLIQIIINPIQKTINSRTIKKFYPWFYYFLLPLLILLFVAIFRRINEYGVTENRYFVFVLACWIFLTVLYLLLSKRKKITTPLLSLAIISLLVSFGFWGAFQVATKSQVYQFKKVFNNIKSTNFITSYDKKQQLSSIIHYLNKKDELVQLETVLGYNPKTTFKTKNKWGLPMKIIDSLSIEVTNDPYANNFENRSYSLNDLDLTIKVKNYDFLKRIYLNNYKKDNDTNNYRFYLQENSSIIEIWKSKKRIGEIDCSNMLKTLKNQSNSYNLDPDLMTIEHHTPTLNFKFIFQDIYLKEAKQGTLEKHLYSATIYVLIKEKDAK